MLGHVQMPSCSARGCRNTSKKGVTMHRFPIDPELKLIWIKNCGMPSFALEDFSELCEYHFAADMWEKPRVDGSKKLKHNAVPTLFGDLVFHVNEKNKKKDVVNPKADRRSIAVQADPKTKQVDVRSRSGGVRWRVHRLDLEEVDQPEPQHPIAREQYFRANKKPELSHAMRLNPQNCTNNEIFAENDECLLSLQRDYRAIRAKPSGYIERIQMLEKLYERSENLRVAMKKTFARKERRYKAKIQKLESKVFATEEFPNALKGLLINDQVQSKPTYCRNQENGDGDMDLGEPNVCE